MWENSVNFVIGEIRIMKLADIERELRGKAGMVTGSGIADGDAEVRELVTDSRNMFEPGTALFFAIRTEGGNDGHRYIKEVYERGIRNFVVEYVGDFLASKNDVNYIQVEDSRKALAAVGKLRREKAERVVAITGSRGKTTVKEMLSQLLGPLRRVSRSPRSYNSKIGVPLSLWQTEDGTETALIEAGISKKGEMEFLAETIEPDTVIFTNIGDAHAEGFSSKEEKGAEKAKLAAGKKVKGIIYPLDDSVLRESVKVYGEGKELTGWSMKDREAPLYIEVSDEGEAKRLDYVWKGEKGSVRVKGTHNYDVENAASALAYMLSEGFGKEVIAERFSKLEEIRTRMNVSEGINGCILILDSYGSDVTTLQPAIDFMRRRQMPGQTLTMIAGEQGSEEDCRRVADLVREGGVSRFIGIGEEIGKHGELFGEGARFFKNADEMLREMSASDFVDEVILLKGAAGQGFEEIYRQLEARKHETVLEVNLDAMVRNYNYFRSLVAGNTGIIAMVKAFGYGVGSYEIAKTLQDCGAAYLAVAVLDEGIDLRRQGIVMPIMVMNPRAVNYKAMFENGLEPVVYSMSMLKEMAEESRKNGVRDYPVHIKLDTGMHRMGFMEEELEAVTRMLNESGRLRAASIFSHLATADCLDMDEFTLGQLERFERMSGKLLKGLGYPVKRHILNSAGIVRFGAWHYDMVRLGIGLYGANTLPTDIEQPLSTVATLRTVIISLREIEGGEAVGYSRKGEVNRKSLIATIPVGYADGIDRRLGNGHLEVMVNGRRARTIGNICMDATMLDVTGIDCKEGDSVEIFGGAMPLQGIADELGTIPYEILTSVSPRVKRVYYRE